VITLGAVTRGDGILPIGGMESELPQGGLVFNEEAVKVLLAVAAMSPARRCLRNVTPNPRRDLIGARDPGLVPGVALVSAVSLIGGASLGPEKALGTMGGGVGSWIARRKGLGTEDSQVNTLAGFAGAYGGLFSTTVIVVMLILEVARPGGRRLTKSLAAEIVASSISFGIYFAIAGAVFVGDYKVPQYAFHDWQLLAGIPLGLLAAVVATLLAGFMMAAARLFGRLKVPAVAKAAAKSAAPA